MPRKKYDINDWATDEALLRIRGLSMRGLSQDQIAEAIGVPVRTFKRWISPKNNTAAGRQMRKAVDMGRDVAVAAVENALFNKAVSGDLGAICYFLNNRAAEHWSNHPELKGMDGKVVFIDDIPREAPDGNTKPAATADSQPPTEKTDGTDST